MLCLHPDAGVTTALYDPDLDPERRKRLAERNKPKEPKQVGGSALQK
jgi:hypothetical protein